MKTLALPYVTAFLLAVPTLLLGAPKQMNLRVVTMSPDFPGEELYAHSPGAKEPGAKLTVKNFLNHEFDKVPVAAGTLVLTAKPDPSSTKDQAAVLGTFKFAPNTNSGILLCLPGASDGAGTINLIDDAKNVFPPGSTHVVNATKSDIKLDIQGKNYEVKAGGRLLIRDQPVDESNASAVKAYVKKDNDWILFSSTSWPHPGNKRVIQIATENANSDKPQIRGLKDISAVR